MVVTALAPVFVLVVTALAPVMVLVVTALARVCIGSYCLGPCVCTQW
jgi:hypothetical protein